LNSEILFKDLKNNPRLAAGALHAHLGGQERGIA
jgi:hypothetical protein